MSESMSGCGRPGTAKAFDTNSLSNIDEDLAFRAPLRIVSSPDARIGPRDNAQNRIKMPTLRYLCLKENSYESVIAPILAMSAKAENKTQKNMENRAMKIAIPLAEGKLCMHFGHCEQFILVDVNEKTHEITGKKLVTPPPHEPGLLPEWLGEQSVTNIIAGGMGQRARGLFRERGITVVVGAPAEEPEKLVADFLAGTLVSGANRCDH